MSDLKAFALRVAALKVLADWVEKELVAARADALQALTSAGADSSSAQIDGAKVAKVSVAGGNPAPYIADRRAFLEWVKANRPGEIEEKVRASFERAILDDAKANGVIVPGVEFRDTTQYVTPTFATGGKDTLATAWREGLLNPLGALDRNQIEAGE